MSVPSFAQDSEAGAGGGISLTQIITIAQAYWKQSLIIAAIVTVIAGVAIKVLPKTFTSTATLIVNVESRDPLAVDVKITCIRPTFRLPT